MQRILQIIQFPVAILATSRPRCREAENLLELGRTNGAVQSAHVDRACAGFLRIPQLSENMKLSDPVADTVQIVCMTLLIGFPAQYRPICSKHECFVIQAE